MKKILFPFFKEKHKFLLDKWWFRLVIVFYIIAFVATPFILFVAYIDNTSGWCYDSLSLFYDNQKLFQSQLEECSKIARDAFPWSIPFAVVGTLAIHYFIQFVFFKIIMNFIVLGGSEKSATVNPTSN